MMQTNKLANAQAAFVEALNIRTNNLLRKTYSVYILYCDIGRVQEENGQLQAAEQSFRQALACNDELETNLFGAHIKIWLAEVLKKRGLFFQAEAQYREALLAAQNSQEDGPPLIPIVLNSLRSVLLKQGKITEAEKVARQAFP